MKIKTKLSLFVLLVWVGSAYSQSIEFGQDAKEIKYWVEWNTSDRHGYDSYGNSKGNNVSWDVKYYNGKISEVIQCFSNQYLLDFQVATTFCRHYVMSDEALFEIITQFEDISVEKLGMIYNKLYEGRKIDNFYLGEDGSEYSVVYLHSNGMATVSKKKIVLSDFPLSSRQKIERFLKELEAQSFKKEIEEEVRRQREIELKSRLVNLKAHAPEEYQKFESELRKQILKRFEAKISSYYYNQSEFFPSHESLKRSKKVRERFLSTYKIYLRTNMSNMSNGDTYTTQKIDYINGNDVNVKLFDEISIKIPTVNFDGDEIMTEVSIDSLNVDFSRGVSTVKVRNGIVTFRKNAPYSDLEALIIEEVSKYKNGKYLISYEVSNVLGKSSIAVRRKKLMSTGGVIATVLGTSIAGSATLVALFYLKILKVP